jgi:3-deoxy-7-phosphoheptulonate synthase
MTRPLDNLNIVESRGVPSPLEVRDRYPLSDESSATVLVGRTALEAILDGADKRWFAVVGPCSIHDPRAALEYAERLRRLAAEVADTILVVMRVYFEKPRTTVGWKGLINDPDMDDSFRIGEGLAKARDVLGRITALGLPAGTEALDPVAPQYTSDLVSWYAIGARTTESQTHRELASGLSAPVGFKNSTDGSIQTAVNALQSAARPHHFLGITLDGRISVFQTRGNRYGHVILRGAESGGPNYDRESVTRTEEALARAGLRRAMVVDCSHANSAKDPERQLGVLDECITQVGAGNRSIVGFMLESNLLAGNQKIPKDLRELRYGVSVTDPCIDWDTTERGLRAARERLAPVLERRLAGDSAA